jgi:hypothetical protein
MKYAFLIWTVEMVGKLDAHLLIALGVVTEPAEHVT